MMSPVEFVRQVKREASKVTWPTRKEVGVTTIMVFILVLLIAAYFILVDFGISNIIKAILKLAA